MVSTMKYLFIPFLFLLIPIPRVSEAQKIIGGETVYVVEKGDTFELIGAKLGINWKGIIKKNNLDSRKMLRIGQKLRVNTRKIVPRMIDDGIIINIPDRMLYVFKKGNLKSAFPIGLGMPFWRGIKRWRTPEGKFRVLKKLESPTWYVPESIQRKMKMEGKAVKTVIQPGTQNPLGRYAIKTSICGIMIHETIWPSTVYQYKSHGCIRVLPEHMEKFFEEVKINTVGELIYRPVKIAISEKGRVFIEVNRDIYGKMKDLRIEARRVIEESMVAHKVDWHRMDTVLKEKSGIPEDVTF